MIYLFLDFDGVICDTVKEAYLLSREVYEGVSPLDSINEAEYQYFRKLRYLITKSWNFYYIWMMLKNSKLSEEFYHKSILHPDRDACLSFDQKYVQARVDLMRDYYDFWNSLDQPFPFLSAIKNFVNNRNDVKCYILTNKVKSPVQHRLAQFGWDDIDIIANEDIKISKSSTITEILQKNKISKAFFIDDSLDNVNECKNVKGLTCLHAGWGYVKEGGLTPEEVIKILESEI